MTKYSQEELKDMFMLNRDINANVKEHCTCLLGEGGAVIDSAGGHQEMSERSDFIFQGIPTQP